MKSYFRVVLSDNAAIVDFEDPDNLLGYGEDKTELFAKSWLNELIPDFCIEDVRGVVMDFFNPGKTCKEYVCYQNAVIKKDGRLSDFDFRSRIVFLEGMARVESYGFPHGSEAHKRFQFPEQS